MDATFQITPCQYQDLLAVEPLVPEFAELKKMRTLPDRTSTRDTLILKVEWEGKVVGYSVAYDRDGDGTLYVWLAAVLPEYRGMGVWSALFEAIRGYAVQHKYHALTIKTRNRFHIMLQYLIRHQWMLTEVVPNNLDVCDNEICAVLTLPEVEK